MPKKTTRYTVKISRDAEKRLRRLPKDLLSRLRRAIWALADEPRPAGYKRMAGHDDLYRIRVGDWRTIYAIEDDKLIVLIIKIGPRGRVYQEM